jgi:hypothetical protein
VVRSLGLRRKEQERGVGGKEGDDPWPRVAKWKYLS